MSDKELRELAQQVLDNRSDPRACVRYGVSLASAVLAEVPEEKLAILNERAVESGSVVSRVRAAVVRRAVKK